MGTDIDDIDKAYVGIGGGKPATKDFDIQPAWWNADDQTRKETAQMIGRAVEFSWEASHAHLPGIVRIVVDRHGIHVTALANRLVRSDNNPAVIRFEVPPDGWLQGCIDQLRGRIDALGRFRG